MTGPPGTGKTLLAKAVATVLSQSRKKLINQGMRNHLFQRHGEYLDIQMAWRFRKNRASKLRILMKRQLLFEMARFHAPSTIFIDEIDSLCSSRGESGEHEASRR